MSDVSILNGIYVDTAANFRTSYPKNLIPVPKKTGLSTGYLRPSDGIIEIATGPGIDRGSIVWNGINYRVMGSKLISLDSKNVVRILGDVGGENEPVTFDYSFDLLAICSAGNLFYYDKTNIKQVTDPDLGSVFDVVWVDGYFMVTDGSNLIVTDLQDPYSINPFKYGASEGDPDPIVGVLKLRNEIYALNSNTIELFKDTGGDFFPFTRVDGAQIPKGVVGTTAACVFGEVIAFVGGGREEPASVYIGTNGSAIPIATQEINTLLLEYTNDELSKIIVEERTQLSHQQLYIHLPDKTLVYDLNASKELGVPAWDILESGTYETGPYRGYNFNYVYNKWVCGDRKTGAIGELTTSESYQFGEACSWEFSIPIISNGGKGFLLNSLEMVFISGGLTTYTAPSIFMSSSVDGVNWSDERPFELKSLGNRTFRAKWFQLGYVKMFKIFKIRGDSSAFISPAKIILDAEPLDG